MSLKEVGCSYGEEVGWVTTDPNLLYGTFDY